MDWFTVTRLGPATWQIAEPIGKLEPRFGVATVNMWLVAGRERAALIDSGMGIGDLSATVRGLTSLPILLCNTHWHWDHCGGNFQFERLAIHQLEFELLKQDQNVEGMRRQMLSAGVRALLPADFDAQAYRIRGTTASLTLCDTDKIDLGGRVLHVLHTPGHSAGHVAYFDAGSGTLFSGDTAYAGPIYACFKGSDPAAFAGSARRLAGLANEVRYIAPGHNHALSDGRFLSEVAGAADDALRRDPLSLPYNDFVSGLEFRARDFSIFLPRSQSAA